MERLCSSKILHHCLSGAGLVLPVLFLSSSCDRTGQRNAGLPNFLVCVSDDQSWLHVGDTPEGFVRTPVFNSLAKEGVQFVNAFVSAPSCGPSRASILTGQDFFRLGTAAMNHTKWPEGLETYADRLASAGYHVGYTGKGWAPGNWKDGNREVSPAGKNYNAYSLTPPTKFISGNDYAENFRDFLDQNTHDAPFCFWLGISEPHREYEEGSGFRSGMDPGLVKVPDFFPDNDTVRNDLLDYALEIEWFDKQVGKVLGILEEKGKLDNTVIILTSDNGMPFPRSKATLYDAGTRVPMVIRWGRIKQPGRITHDLISLTDIAPTLYDIAGLQVPEEVTGRSFLELLIDPEEGKSDKESEFVIMGLERHLPGSRSGSTCYPSRAIRTQQYLYIRNFEPGRMPSGDPGGSYWPDDDPVRGYGDTDGSPTKTDIIRLSALHPEFYRWAFDKRPQEELYDLGKDIWQLNDLATDEAYTEVKEALAFRLETELRRLSDPRIIDTVNVFEKIASEYPIIGR